MLRQYKRNPDALLLLAGNELPVMSRDEARSRGISYLSNRSAGRESRGMLATYAPRGDGKSRYIDIFCGLSGSDLGLDSTTHSFLPIPITFIHMMNLDPLEWDGEPSEDGEELLKRHGKEKMSLLAATAICRRVLCTYLGGPRYWSDFRKLAIGKVQLTSLSEVIGAIERHFQESTGLRALVLVGVDELLVAESRFPSLILRQLGDMLDSGDGWRKCCLTTLDAKMLQENLARMDGLKGVFGSRRFIRYVSLPLLDLDEVVTELKNLVPSWRDRESDLRVLVELTSGHPRSLSVLFDLLKTPNSSSKVLGIVIHEYFALASVIFDLTRSTDDIIMHMLAKSVLQETVPTHFGDPVLNSPELVDGIPTPFVPTLSLVFLKDWSKLRQFHDDKTIATVATMIATLLEISVEDKGMEYF